MSGKVNKLSMLSFLIFLQVSTLLIYLNANLVIVGQPGTAIPVLIGFMGLSAVLILFLFKSHRQPRAKRHFFLFLLLNLWLAFKVFVDLGDLAYLKQISVGTTGGILLFYLVGAFLRIGYQEILIRNKSSLLTYSVLVLFIGLLLWIIFQFSGRMHPKFFYLTELNGSYQRAGNFLSISFITVSYLYLSLHLKKSGSQEGYLRRCVELSIYTLTMLMTLAVSQLVGSNNATAVCLGVYLITVVVASLARQNKLFESYCRGQLTLPFSFIRDLIRAALLIFVFFVCMMTVVIQVSDFDITSTRLFGFGSGTNTSIQSRIEILSEHGVSQLSYAPLLGDLNVASQTTGNSGRRLHSFIPYIFANLGLVGFSIVVFLFYFVFVQLYREIRSISSLTLQSYSYSMHALYGFLILSYLFILANLATSISWAVIWFALGFISKPFGYVLNEKNS